MSERHQKPDQLFKQQKEPNYAKEIKERVTEYKRNSPQVPDSRDDQRTNEVVKSQKTSHQPKNPFPRPQKRKERSGKAEGAEESVRYPFLKLVVVLCLPRVRHKLVSP